MKNLEIIPDFLSMYGVFTSQSTFHNRQEMSKTPTAKKFYVYIYITTDNHVVLYTYQPIIDR